MMVFHESSGLGLWKTLLLIYLTEHSLSFKRLKKGLFEKQIFKIFTCIMLGFDMNDNILIIHVVPSPIPLWLAQREKGEKG